jgi:DNA-directed RNA polymerase specialized sigma24 family protein
MPLPEVAVAVGIPLGTAKSRLHRSIGVLRATIDGEAGIDTAVVPEARPA